LRTPSGEVAPRAIVNEGARCPVAIVGVQALVPNFEQVCLRTVHEAIVTIVERRVIGRLVIVVAFLLHPVVQLLGTDCAVVLVDGTFTGDLGWGQRLSTSGTRDVASKYVVRIKSSPASVHIPVSHGVHLRLSSSIWRVDPTPHARTAAFGAGG
jgi:hypothetical protein